MKFKGTVKKNLGRGTKLGFPTANIDAPKDLDDGLYIGLVETATSLSRVRDISPKGEKNQALIFIGEPKTFNESDRKAEIYILDFTGDLYDQEIEIEILKKLRNNIKFDSQEALVEQMKQDEIDAKQYFSKQ